MQATREILSGSDQTNTSTRHSGGRVRFLLKNSPPETLLAGIEAVQRGEMLFSAPVMRKIVETYTNSVPPRSLLTTDLPILTGREREVLRLVARGSTNAEIAIDLGVSETTIKTHVNRTMANLGISSRAQAVAVAYEAGLVRPHGNSRIPR